MSKQISFILRRNDLIPHFIEIINIFFYNYLNYLLKVFSNSEFIRIRLKRQRFNKKKKLFHWVAPVGYYNRNRVHMVSRRRRWRGHTVIKSSRRRKKRTQYNVYTTSRDPTSTIEGLKTFLYSVSGSDNNYDGLLLWKIWINKWNDVKLTKKKKL